MGRIGVHGHGVADHGNRRVQRQTSIAAGNHAVDPVVRSGNEIQQTLAIVVPVTVQGRFGRPLVVRDLDGHVHAVGHEVGPVLQATLGDVPVGPVGDALRKGTVVHGQVLGRILQAQLDERVVVRRQGVGVIPGIVDDQGAPVSVLADDEMVVEAQVAEMDVFGLHYRMGSIRFGEVPVQVDTVGVGSVARHVTVGVVQGQYRDLGGVHQLGHLVVTRLAVVFGQVVGQGHEQEHAHRFIAVHGAGQAHFGFGSTVVHVVGNDDAVQVTSLDRLAPGERTTNIRVVCFQLGQLDSDLGLGRIDSPGIRIKSLAGRRQSGPPGFGFLAAGPVNVGHIFEIVSRSGQPLGFFRCHSWFENQVIGFGRCIDHIDLFTIE